MKREIGEKEVDVQMMAFLPSVDKPGWWWVQYTCMRRTSWSPRYGGVAKEATKEASFATQMDQRRQLTWTIM